MRGGGREAIRPPAVPVLPDLDQLGLLLEDHEDVEDTSPAERRLCASHLWLVQALRTGRINAWADVWIRPHDPNYQRGPICTAQNLRIDPARWDDCDVDYSQGTLNSRDGESFETTHEHHRVWGILILSRIAVDETQFLIALQDPRGIGVKARLHRRPSGDKDAWTIRWNEQSWLLEGPDTQYSKRGLRAIALLLRYPGEIISWHLLQGLARDPPRNRGKTEEMARRDDRLYSEVKTCSHQVFLQKKDLKIAENFISEAVAEFKVNLSEDECEEHDRRVREDVRGGVKAALEKIASSSGLLGKHAAKSISDQLRDSAAGYVYSSVDRTLSWHASIDTAEGD
jgi:hypothetical protein